MTTNNISFFSSVYITSPEFFSEERPTETLIRCIKNASELFFSLPLTLSYLDQPWQFVVAPNEDFPISKGAYVIFWSLFTSIAAYQPVTRSLLFFVACIIPKIYNRYATQNYSDKTLVEPTSLMPDKIIKDNDPSDHDLSYLTTHFLETKNPEIVERIIEKNWNDIKYKNSARSQLISYYLKEENPNAVEKILFREPLYENFTDLMTLFHYYLEKEEAEKAKKLFLRTKLTDNDSWKEDYCMIHLAIHFLRKNDNDSAMPIINKIIAAGPGSGFGIKRSQAFLAAHSLKLGDITKALSLLGKVSDY